MLSFSYTSTFLLVQVALLGSSESSSAKQYIATSQSDVINGVPLNHDYTDLSTTRDLPSGGRRSAPGCPKNEGGYPWLYHVDAKCYLAGTRGPCKSTFDPFAFWDLRDNSDYGTCYCGCLRRYNDTFEVVTDARNPDKVCFSDRTYFYNYLWIFVNKEQKCFSSYEQVKVFRDAPMTILHISNAIVIVIIIVVHVIFVTRVHVNQENGLWQIA